MVPRPHRIDQRASRHRLFGIVKEVGRRHVLAVFIYVVVSEYVDDAFVAVDVDFGKNGRPGSLRRRR